MLPGEEQTQDYVGDPTKTTGADGAGAGTAEPEQALKTPQEPTALSTEPDHGSTCYSWGCTAALMYARVLWSRPIGVCVCSALNLFWIMRKQAVWKQFVLR